MLVCGGKIGKHGGTFCRNRRQKGEYVHVAEKTFWYIPEADYLGLADIPAASNLKLTFEETVRSKHIYLWRAEAVL